MSQVDVLIIGAGAAGLFCAGVAAQQGLQVLVLDHSEKVAEKIQEYSDYIKGNLSEHCVEEYLLEIFTNAVICTKHPGFSEEKEWRIIHSLGQKQSHFIEKEIQNIKGVPQIIYKIPFYKNITGLALTDLIDRVIIGPCEFPDVTYQAICSVLSEAGMTSPEEIIKKSEIPLRQS